jgi:hypothetical protein
MPGSADSQSSSFFTYPVTYAVSGLLRRLSADPQNTSGDWSGATSLSQSVESMNGVYTPPRRHASPFQPPPLTPLTLKGYKSNTTQSGRLLSKALAEEIRLLLPPRLQLVDNWSLTYSLEQDGVSLATLYEKCDDYRGKRGGFVLVVQDGAEGVSIPLPYKLLESRGRASNDDVDIWSIPQRVASPIPALLWHWRMLFMALAHSFITSDPPTPTASSKRRDNERTTNDYSCAPQAFKLAESFIFSSRK